MVLFVISFIAGVLTVLAPCVLPLLPVIVGGTVAEDRSGSRPIVIAISLGLSVLIFTLLLKVSSAFIHVPESVWLWISGLILIAFGTVMLFPKLWDSLPGVNSIYVGSNQTLASGYRRNSFWGDVIMGASLGPVFSSCSPTYFVILATVLPASFFVGTIDLLAYVVGLSGFLLVIALLGQRLVDRLGVTIEPTGWFRRGMGLLFVIVGILILTGVEKKIETVLISRGFDATQFEQVLLGAPTGQKAPLTILSAEQKAVSYKKAPELVTPDAYINTAGQPITIGEFKGKKVVLLDIWTYSCINCQRTLPYIKAWYEKYHDQGLEIIGVHTPEFSFEKLPKNVQDAVERFGIKYPVVLDNQYQTWNAYGNQYWPRKYLIDIDGYVIYDHAGEGNYAETEEAIQTALAERAQRLGTAMPSSTLTTPENVVNVGQVQSPETYFGSSRNEYLGTGSRFTAGDQTLHIPTNPIPNALYLDGTWNFSQEYAQNKTAGAKIQFTYSATNVYFVAASTKGVRIHVTRDGGKPLGAARGVDVDADGYATIREDRLYHLIGDNVSGVHTLEIHVESPGLEAYTFTFG